MQSPRQVSGSSTTYNFPWQPDEWMARRTEEGLEGGPALHAFLLDVWRAAADGFREEGARIDDVATEVADRCVEKLDLERLALLAHENPALVFTVYMHSHHYNDLDQGLRVGLEDLAYFSACEVLEYLEAERDRLAAADGG